MTEYGALVFQDFLVCTAVFTFLGSKSESAEEFLTLKLTISVNTDVVCRYSSM